jgi:hypothetical protein
MKFSREWAMPSGDTFSIPPIAEFVARWTEGCEVIVDPFARNSKVGTITNDLNPQTSADWHMDSRIFLQMLWEKRVCADAVLFDPPYSPHQIKEIYESIGLRCKGGDTQNGALYRECREMMNTLLRLGGIALSFGWNSCSFGEDFAIREILLVAHGGAHNDTICVASEKVSHQYELF